MMNPKNQRLEFGAPAITRVLTYLIEICCTTIGWFVFNNAKSLFSSAEEEEEFKDMFNLFTESANSNILLDFCYY